MSNMQKAARIFYLISGLAFAAAFIWHIFTVNTIDKEIEEWRNE